MRLPGGRSAARARAACQRLLHEGTTDEYRSFTARAAERFPDDADIRIERATSLLTSDLEMARIEALRAVGRDAPQDPVRLVRAAIVLVAARDLDGARACIERAADLPGPLVTTTAGIVVANEISHIRGQIAALEGNDTLAAEALGTALGADLSNAGFATSFAKFLAGRQRFDEALDVIDRTLAQPVGEGQASRRACDELRELRDKLAKHQELLRQLKLAETATPLGPLGTSTITSTGEQHGGRSSTPD